MEELNDSQLLDRQKIFLARLYAKIDYLKQVRLKIPVFSVIVNYGLFVLARKQSNPLSDIIFTICLMLMIILGALILIIVKRAFDINCAQLAYLYEQMKISGDKFHKIEDGRLAEPASKLWILLFALIALSGFLPILLISFF